MNTEAKFSEKPKNGGRLNARVLVLNQSFEPITVCNVKRAVTLLMLGKAEIISQDEDRALRTVSGTFPLPVVIRLRRYIILPYKKVILTRKNILRRDSYKCAYCGRSDIVLTIDHIIPKARGGADSWENLITACTKCNNKKGDRTPHEAGMRLLYQPFVPSHILFIKNTVGKIDTRWKPYLFIN
ncbi:MAG: HNH endonuclease [Ignavibacteriaceae bacterium]|nr:HNH endonuclease [Ignavibacteriaceae bacterium]